MLWTEAGHKQAHSRVSELRHGRDVRHRDTNWMLLFTKAFEHHQKPSESIHILPTALITGGAHVTLVWPPYPGSEDVNLTQQSCRSWLQLIHSFLLNKGANLCVNLRTVIQPMCFMKIYVFYPTHLTRTLFLKPNERISSSLPHMEKLFKNRHPFQCSPRGLCNHNLSQVRKQLSLGLLRKWAVCFYTCKRN